MANTSKEKYIGDVCIKTNVIPYLEEISNLLSIAFGPMGDAVMIHQKSPREIKITKVKIKILNEGNRIHFSPHY